MVGGGRELSGADAWGAGPVAEGAIVVDARRVGGGRSGHYCGCEVFGI